MKKLILLVLLGWLATASAMQVRLLISLGMPDEVLKAYFTQAAHYHVPLVIRGLYRQTSAHGKPLGSHGLQETVARIKALVPKQQGAGVLINPLLFRAFDIRAVPALVFYGNDIACLRQATKQLDLGCEPKSFTVLYGNLPLSKLLAHVAQRSSSRAVQHAARVLGDKDAA